MFKTKVIKANPIKSSNHEGLQLLHALVPRNIKHNAKMNHSIIMNAMTIYGRIDEKRTDHVINAFVSLCYNLRCYDTIGSPSTSTVWTDIERLSDTQQQNISFGPLLACCIQSNHIVVDHCVKTLRWIHKYQYELKINESLIIRLIKRLNHTNELDCIHQLLCMAAITYTIPIRTALIKQYAMHKAVHKASAIFDSTKRNERDCIMHGAMMSGLIYNRNYTDALTIYNQMDHGHKDAIIYSLAIKSCNALGDKQLIQRIEKELCRKETQVMESTAGLPIKASLIDHYGHCGDMDKATDIFNSVRNQTKNTAIVNAMITAYVNNGYNHEALRLYDDQISKPDSISHSLALKACTNTCNFNKGKDIINTIGQIRDVHIQLKHTVIHFYGACGDINKAFYIFKSISDAEKDCVSINALMTAYINNEHYKDALKLYDATGYSLDDTSHSLAIKCCTNTGNFNKGKKIYSALKKAKRKGDISVNIKTALMDLYGRCHDVSNAEHIFNSIPTHTKNVVCYNAMMNVYVVNQRYDECLQLLNEMGYTRANSISYTIAFTACAYDNRVTMGQQIYHQLRRQMDCKEIMSELSLVSSVIHMFGRFGNLQQCQQLFGMVPTVYLNKIGIWNVMIQAYGINGDALNAKRLFDEMRQNTNIVVDAKGYVTIFNALSHGGHPGNVTQAKHIWNHDIGNDINCSGNVLVVSSFVDCLSRNGCVFEAYDIVHAYEKTNTLCEEMWNSVLNGCKMYKNALLMRHVLYEMRDRNSHS
eukprot:62787_1